MKCKVHICKHFSDNFSIQNDLKQENAVLQLIFKFALVCVIRKVQENQVGLQFNGTHHFWLMLMM
jgi:hypothetical protein